MSFMPLLICERKNSELQTSPFAGNKAIKVAFALILLILFAASCQSTRQARKVFITDSIALSLLPPDAVGKAIDDYQLITGSYGEREFMAEAYLFANKERLDMTVLSTSGQTICTIVWDGVLLEFSSPYISAAKARIEYIVMDLQLALYDAALVKEIIEEAGLTYISEADGEDYARMIYADGGLIWQAKKEGRSLKVENTLRGYSYEVESLL